MKKVVILVFMVTMLSALFAELVVNIPFDLDIVGDSYAEVGDYDYESEWIEVTNTGGETQAYTFLYTYENMPTGWNMSTCNDVGTCYMPNWATPIELEAGASLNIHIIVYVRSCSGFNFDFTFNEGDLTEPLIYNFTFNTADNISIIYGDVNGDENVSSYDAALTLQYSAGLIFDWTEDQITAGDVNGDENISSYDAALILQYSAGLISEFPVEG
ncbi:MAG: hypothetical protein H8E33_04770 [Candidatus Cloacimonetes bacterium]|nr:hypothetical protein [Candidatus Cloacimonadota bacterium]